MKKLAALILLALSAQAFAAERLATVYDVKPAALMGDNKPLYVGQALYEGEKLWTKPTGRAGLALADGSVLRLEGGAELTVAKPLSGLGTLLKLAKGLLRVDAAKQEGRQLLIETAGGVAGVKGTQYQVEAGEAKTEVKVLEGTVELKALSGSASVLVHAEEAAVSYPDRVDAVRKLSADEVKALKGAMKELVAQKKKEYTKRVRDARGKRTPKQEGK